MNDLGTLLTWSAFQAALLALAAAVVYPFAARRGPAAGAAVAAAGLGGSVVLTLLVFCPLPSWWDWRPPTPAATAPAGGGEEPRPSPHDDETPIAATDGPSWPVRLMGLTRDGAGRAAAPFADRSQSGWAVAAIIFLTGASLGLLWLAGGLWAVSDLRRRSRPVLDEAAVELLRQLRQEIGCHIPVGLREGNGLGAPAAAGWLRPVVLLPADWRDWTDAELRAALAHELAHVRRSDYLLGLLARLSLALHFCNPLLYWLAGRLRLQQELAADGLAAPLAGGRDAYLLGLARLALRLGDRRPAGWPASPLFSPGMLMRRIRMLKTRDGRFVGATPRWGRVMLVGLLAAVVVGVAALRCPAQKDSPLHGVTFTDAGTVEAGDAGPEPFEIPDLPPDAMGVVWARPSAVLSRPGLKKYADDVDKGIPEACKAFGLPRAFGLRVEEIAQVSATIIVKTNKDAKGPQSALIFGTPGMIRATRDFDWVKELKDLIPGIKESRHGDRVIYHFPTDGPLAPMFGKAKVCFLVPDARTVVFDTEEGLIRRIDHPAADAPGWAAEFRRVDRGLAAVVIDNRNGAWARELAARSEPEPHVAPFQLHTSWVVLGVSAADDGITCKAAGRFDGEETAEKAMKEIDGGLSAARAALAAMRDGDETRKDMGERTVSFFQALLEKPELQREGASVRLRCRVKGDVDAILTGILEGEIGL